MTEDREVREEALDRVIDSVQARAPRYGYVAR